MKYKVQVECTNAKIRYVINPDEVVGKKTTFVDTKIWKSR
jgi:hypothetical protein